MGTITNSIHQQGYYPGVCARLDGNKYEEKSLWDNTSTSIYLKNTWESKFSGDSSWRGKSQEEKYRHIQLSR